MDRQALEELLAELQKRGDDAWNAQRGHRAHRRIKAKAYSAGEQGAYGYAARKLEKILRGETT